ncbi:MAG: 2-amino-4-hydroxy-6-hydroxymethyldihydropteridine diphosphokinase [Gemmatimonadales bacterium]
MPETSEPGRPRPVRAWIALGSNLGDRDAWLAFARTELERLDATRIVAVSSVEETEPLGGRDQPAYLNQMVLLETGLDPGELLRYCQRIERAAGRVRRERWASRTLDLDIVRYDDLQLDVPGLTLPHPGLASRDFWRREMDEIGAGLRTED